MNLWWLVDFERLAEEKAAVEKLVAEGWFALDTWEVSQGRLATRGTITAHGASYPVRLIYPDQFPSVPAWVEPRDPEAKWTNHQYGAGGSLCLELRPDNWVTSASGADMLRSAHHLLQTENPNGEGAERSRVPSAHHVGEIQSYAWQQPILLGAGCAERLQNGTATDLKGFRWLAIDDAFHIYITDAEDRGVVGRAVETDIKSWRIEFPVHVVRANAPSPAPGNRKALIAAAGFDEETVAKMADGAALVLFATEEGTTPYYTHDATSVQVRGLTVLSDDAGGRSGRTAAAAGKSVTIVGAGSVGSKLAESLLRSGVHSLLLVDGDVFLPGNLERHVLDWRDVGSRKVHAMKRRLLQIAPGTDVRVIDQNLNWQRSARTHAQQFDAIAASDMLIDATGDPALSLTLGALAASNGRAFVAVEVFEGGIGALVACCLPKRDPPYVLARAAFLEWCKTTGVAPPKSGTKRYEALSEFNETLVADDAAITMAAGHAARVVLDVLDDRPAPSDAAWLLIGFRPEWEFKHGHGHCIGINVGKPVEAPAATSNAEAQAFALGLANEVLDAAQARG